MVLLHAVFAIFDFRVSVFNSFILVHQSFLRQTPSYCHQLLLSHLNQKLLYLLLLVSHSDWRHYMSMK